MPDHAAGRKARCRQCGSVLTVPIPAPVLASSVSVPHTEPQQKVSRWRRIYEGQPPPGDDEPNLTPLISTGFWSDTVKAFVFFRKPGNLASWMGITFVHVLLTLVGYGGWIAVYATILLYGYICAFYMGIIREVASGEDALPNVWIHNVLDDLIMPMIQFLGTFAWVLLPAGVTALAYWWSDKDVPWGMIKIVALCGMLLWPAVMLGVAIGGGFDGLWPHVVLRTILSAPIAYLAVCLAILAAVAVLMLTQLPQVQNAIGSGLLLWFIDIIITPYAMIVTMIVIGLFYRHFKHRFPWAAE